MVVTATMVFCAAKKIPVWRASVDGKSKWFVRQFYRSQPHRRAGAGLAPIGRAQKFHHVSIVKVGSSRVGHCRLDQSWKICKIAHVVEHTKASPAYGAIFRPASKSFRAQNEK
jgi:hypothetical protein